MVNWREIWSKERTVPDDKPNLEFLIEADGFNSGAGKIETAAWIEYASSVAEFAGLRESDSIFEVGCGSGAFLYEFYKKGHRVGGIDYSPSLIELATFAMPGMDFDVREALETPSDPMYDFVVANSVFQYFPSYDYAADTILKMYHKADRIVGILDLNDSAHEEEALRIRRGALTEGEYERKYAGLNHLFYERDFVAKVLAGQKASVWVYDQRIENYGNNKFRFNVVIEKW